MDKLHLRASMIDMRNKTAQRRLVSIANRSNLLADNTDNFESSWIQKSTKMMVMELFSYISLYTEAVVLQGHVTLAASKQTLN